MLFSRRQIVIGGVQVGTGIVLAVTTETEAASGLTLRFEASRPMSIAEFLTEQGYVLIPDEDYHQVVREIRRGRFVLAGQPLGQRRRHLFVYVNRVPIQGATTALDTYFPRDGDRIQIRKERYNRRKHAQGVGG